MEQFKYVLEDLRHNKRVNFFFIVQITIVMVLISLSISESLRSRRGYQKMERLKTTSGVILLVPLIRLNKTAVATMLRRSE
ncbi:MAG: hypothetical protein IJM46_07730 [Oscillospiraceae bacterium]|nr:hypothetical protein [Oscillospiraceae bacterium]